MRKKIVFLLPSLGAGGAERVFLGICNHLDESHFKVTLCLLKKEGEFIQQIDSPKFEIQDLNVSRVRHAFWPMVRFIWSNKPDIVISTLGHLNALLGAIIFCLPAKTRFVARESNIVTKRNHKKLTIFLYRWCYKNFDKIVVQSTDMAEDLLSVVKNLNKNQILKINNPINGQSIKKRIKTNEKLLPDKKINLVTVGSLTYQKGYDMLIRSLSKFKNKERYHLTIIGKGALRNELEALARSLGIEDLVTFTGFQSNPFMYIAQASIFVSSSRFEGFPNAVLEALACNVPVIGNDYKGGIREIVKSNEYGKVIDINNSKLFEYTCEEILQKNNPKFRLDEAIIARYGIGKITKKYEELFHSL